MSAAAESLPLSIFARLMERLSRFEGDVIPFHIGDTVLAPPRAARLCNISFDETSDRKLYTYPSPSGDGLLIDALVDKLHRINQLDWVEPANVQVTAGATHALSCCMRAVMDPGDDMLLLAPYWPLIRGIAHSCCVRPVEATFSHLLLNDQCEDPEALLEKYITPKTTAMYVCNPNNPDGKVYTRAELEAIARVAKRHGLWVIADEVYEYFLYDGRKHISFASLPGMRDQTLTSYSFSKSYAQAGLRVGYVVGPAGAIASVRKMTNHTIYGVPRSVQRAALAALTTGDEFLAQTRRRYRDARDWAAKNIAAPCAIPQGATYLFIDLSRWISAEGACSLSVLERMAGAGLLLAPGAAFGQDFAQWARLCFVSVTQAQLEEGIGRFNDVLAQPCT